MIPCNDATDSSFFKISRSISARRSWRRNRAFSSRSSATEAFSPHGANGGANFLCHARRVWVLTPTALAAAARVYFSSTTNRTASRLNSSPNRFAFEESVV